MPRYFFNVHDGVSLPDPEGSELASMEAAKREAVSFAGILLADNPDQFWNGEQWHMDVTDETGLVLFTLHFMAAMSPAAKGK